MIPQDSSLFERYFIKERIGTGSASFIFLAQDLVTHSTVTIKLTPKASVNTDIAKQRIYTEREILSKVDHPHILKYLDFVEDDVNYYLITEYFKGLSLLSVLRNNGKFSDWQAHVVLKQIISALTYLHQKGIAHHDIKPDNILVNMNNMETMLIDFGFSMSYDDMTSLSNNFCGSLEYVAPELLKRQSYNPFAADMWSIGVLLYTMLTVELPWSSTVPEIMMDNIINANINYPENMNEAMSLSIRSLLLVEPSQRLTAEKFQQIQDNNSISLAHPGPRRKSLVAVKSLRSSCFLGLNTLNRRHSINNNQTPFKIPRQASQQNTKIFSGTITTTTSGDEFESNDNNSSVKLPSLKSKLQ